MYKALLNTASKPTNIDLGVAVRRPGTKVIIRVYDPSTPGAVYMDRYQIIEKANETVSFEVRLPRTMDKTAIQVLSGNGADQDVRVTRLKRKRLKQYMPCLDGNGGRTKKVLEFVKFAQEFSHRAALHDPGTYYSDQMNFRIDYKPVITDDETGAMIPTPARIHNESGRMEISQKDFTAMTIPERMAMLTHEFSHFNLNVDQDDEIEADLNGLKIYLGLGYPSIEATKSFTNVFKSHDTAENRERYDYLLQFIRDFDKKKHRFCLPA